MQFLPRFSIKPSGTLAGPLALGLFNVVGVAVPLLVGPVEGKGVALAGDGPVLAAPKVALDEVALVAGLDLANLGGGVGAGGSGRKLGLFFCLY